MTSLTKQLKRIVAAITVLALITVWLYQAVMPGVDINPMLSTFALVVGIAGAITLFGKQRIKSAFDLIK